MVQDSRRYNIGVMVAKCRLSYIFCIALKLTSKLLASNLGLPYLCSIIHTKKIIV